MKTEVRQSVRLVEILVRPLITGNALMAVRAKPLYLRVLLRVAIYLLLPIVLLVTVGLIWLRWESSLPRDEWFTERQGHITDVHVEESIESHSTVSQSVRLRSSSGLQVTFRVIRKVTTDAPVPLLLILGGHRTGSDAVDLFGDPGQRVIVGVDYPYDGPDKVTGFGPTLRTRHPGHGSRRDADSRLAAGTGVG